MELEMPRTEQSATWIGPKGFAHAARGVAEAAEELRLADMALAYGPYMAAAYISSSILVRHERSSADVTASF